MRIHLRHRTLTHPFIELSARKLCARRSCNNLLLSWRNNVWYCYYWEVSAERGWEILKKKKTFFLSSPSHELCTKEPKTKRVAINSKLYNYVRSAAAVNSDNVNVRFSPFQDIAMHLNFENIIYGRFVFFSPLSHWSNKQQWPHTSRLLLKT